MKVSAACYKFLHFLVDGRSKIEAHKIERLGQNFLRWHNNKKNDAVRKLFKEAGLNTTILDFDDFSLPLDYVSPSEFELFFYDFDVENHIQNTLLHKKRIMQIYDRLIRSCITPELTKEAISNHDNTKLTNFEEIVGYTIRDVWKVPSNLCSRASKHHFLNNPHHPEYFINRSDLSRLRIMDYVDLLESIIDKIVLNWEQNYINYSEPIPIMWSNLPEKYLKSYTKYDKLRAKSILDSCK